MGNMRPIGLAWRGVFSGSGKSGVSAVLKVFLPAFLLGTAMLLVGLLKSCGDGSPEDDASENSKDRHPNNYEAWRDAWDGERWIVATKDLRPKEESLRAAFATAFTSVLNKRGAFLPGEAVSAESFWPQAQRVPLLFVNGISLPKNGHCDVTRCPTFAFVRLPHSRVPWDSLFSLRSGRAFDFSFAKSADVMRLHWDTLNSMDGVLFAEPDLAAPSANVPLDPISRRTEPAAQAVASEKPAGSALVEEAVEYPDHLKSVRLAEAEAVERSRNYTLRNVVVAVLDTGVDWEHPALKHRMFQIPRRDPGARASVFRQGDFEYFGDAFGIDASWEKGASAQAVENSPGSADVGGAGKPCPVGEDGMPRRSLTGTDCGHGTHVAGIIAGETTPPDVSGNTSGYTLRGVCRNCKIVSVRAASVDLRGPEPNNGKILDSSQIRGMQFVASLQEDSTSLYVNVLNMSIGQYDDSRAMRTIIKSLSDSGIVLVAAASNNNTDRRAFPAAYKGVVAVCATSNEGQRGRYGKAVFSNFGEWVDICAPGELIWSTFPGAQFSELSGTSMAAPMVAGVAGYLMGIAENLGIPAVGRAKAVEGILLAASNWNALYSPVNAPFNAAYQFSLPDGTGAEFLGRGFLDMENALKRNAVARSEVPVPQVQRGCVASSIGQPNPNATFDAFTSVPLLLGAFALLLRLRRVRSPRGLPMRWSR